MASIRNLRTKRLFTAILGRNSAIYYDGIVAVVLIFLSQLLTCVLQYATRKINDFPATILAMMLVALTMIFFERIAPNVEEIYKRYLQGPTNIINKHMSIGFTVPFTMVMKEDALSLKAVGLIMLGFLLAGILNTLIAFFVSFGLQTAILKMTKTNSGASCLQDHDNGSISESNTLRNQQLENTAEQPQDYQHQQHIQDQDQELRRFSPLKLSLCKTLWGHCVVNPVPVLSLVGIIAIGFPVAKYSGHYTALDTFLLLLLWTGTLTAQNKVKRATQLQRHKRWHLVLTTLLNAVLWTSLGIIAYTIAKAAIQKCTVIEVLHDFNTNTTLAGLIYTGHNGDGILGAGDIAATILDAGIVTWGLKLFECRAQLLSRAGLTAVIVGSSFAIINIIGGPLLMQGMGLEPSSSALAFAARSVTLALAGPAMKSLGGDVGLNAALVVFNGIIFQMALGLGICQWGTAFSAYTERRARRIIEDGASRDSVDVIRHEPSLYPSSSSSDTETVAESDLSTRRPIEDAAHLSCKKTVRGCCDLEKNTNAECIVYLRGGANGGQECTDVKVYDSPGTVAAGMTVGINAAAMGTAYLYNEESRAAPYAALSMTVFGVMTVVFTSVQPLASWLVARTA